MRCFIDVCPFEGWLDTNVGTKHKDQIFMRHPPYDSIDARFLAITIALLTRYLLGNWISAAPTHSPRVTCIDPPFFTLATV